MPTTVLIAQDAGMEFVTPWRLAVLVPESAVLALLSAVEMDVKVEKPAGAVRVTAEVVFVVMAYANPTKPAQAVKQIAEDVLGINPLQRKRGIEKHEIR